MEEKLCFDKVTIFIQKFWYSNSINPLNFLMRTTPVITNTSLNKSFFFYLPHYIAKYTVVNALCFLNMHFYNYDRNLYFGHLKYLRILLKLIRKYAKNTLGAMGNKHLCFKLHIYFK